MSALKYLWLIDAQKKKKIIEVFLLIMVQNT